MCLRQVILTLALLPLALQAQLLPVSNVVIRGGIAPGYTELQTNGMIRWNESLLKHEGWNGTEWAPIAGSGSGFPLTNNVSAGGFSISDVNTLTATSAIYAQTVTASFIGDGAGITNLNLDENYAVNGQNITGRWFSIWNTVGADAAVVSGGTNNTALYSFSVTSGGKNNKNESFAGFIGGGIGNEIYPSSYNTIVAGLDNYVSGSAAFIGGGINNTNQGSYSVIVGGEKNKTTGIYATVPGGFNNLAADSAFAAGIGAKATNYGSAVFSLPGTTNETYGSSGDNTFNVRSVGGMHFLSPFIRLYDTNQVQWGILTPTGGVQIGANSFYIRPSGDVEQDTTNTATLGIVTAQTVTASFFGDGAGLTNFSPFDFVGFTGSTNNLFHDGTNLMFGDRVVGTIDPGVFEVDFFGGLMPKDISIVVTDDLFEYDGAGSIMPKDS